MKLLLSLLFSAFTASGAMASDNSCTQLKAELQGLQKAQKAIMTSLVNNHESFASTLEEYSVAAKSGKNIASPMEKSATAFRRRGMQGKQMADRLNTATADLMSRIAECL